MRKRWICNEILELYKKHNLNSDHKTTQVFFLSLIQVLYYFNISLYIFRYQKQIRQVLQFISPSKQNMQQYVSGVKILIRPKIAKQETKENLQTKVWNTFFVGKENLFELSIGSAQWGHVVIPPKNFPLDPCPIAFLPPFGTSSSWEGCCLLVVLLINQDFFSFPFHWLSSSSFLCTILVR